MTDFLAPYTALGEALDVDFRRAGYAEEAFPELAARHVERSELHRGFALDALARWAISEPSLPEQHDLSADFGDPPITLWSNQRFFVSALVWRSSTTSIHQHAFSGAFQVLQGCSVHARYTFDGSRTVSEELQLGRLLCTGVERLGPGALREIPGGARGAHALFHLEHPSVSLVVRTHEDAHHPIQLEYEPPGLAFWPLARGRDGRRVRQVVRMLAEVDPEQACAGVGETVATLSGAAGYILLRELLEAGDLELSLRALSLARPRLDPELAQAFELALRELDRKTYLMRRRDAVREPELRYLLAILLNAPTRRHALSLAEAYAPGRRGAETLVGWLRALAQVTIKLQVGGAPWEPNVLGLPQPDDASCAALRAALEGEERAPQGKLPFYEAVRHGATFAPLFRE